MVAGLSYAAAGLEVVRRLGGRVEFLREADAICAGWQSVARTGALLLRRRRAIDGNWREVAIGGADGGVVAPPPAGDRYAATLLIGGLEAEG